MLIVARYLDGRVIKGSTTDFKSSNETFHVTPSHGGTAQRVSTQGLKAVFFVRTLEGNPSRPDIRDFPDQNGRVRSRIWLRFRDGEQMPAWPVSPSLGDRGFWVLPTDPGSNLEKTYVFRHAVDRILEGDKANEAARLENERGSMITSTATPSRLISI
jgi:hypothetical protein